MDSVGVQRESQCLLLGFLLAHKQADDGTGQWLYDPLVAVAEEEHEDGQMEEGNAQEPQGHIVCDGPNLVGQGKGEEKQGHGTQHETNNGDGHG